MPMLRFLKNNRDVAIFAALILLVVGEAGTIYHQHVQLKEATLAYKNPETKTAIREVRVEGPVRIVYRKVEVPGQPVIIEKIVERAPVTTTTETAKESTPIAVGTILASPRTDRWLAGVSLDKFAPNTAANWRVMGGYGFRNRLDILIGASVESKPTPFVEAITRF